jgi:hypothetical protein
MSMPAVALGEMRIERMSRRQTAGGSTVTPGLCYSSYRTGVTWIVAADATLWLNGFQLIARIRPLIWEEL